MGTHVYETSEDVDRQGICLEKHEAEDGSHTVFVSYYTKAAAGPDTQPLYSCWVQTSDGRKSKQLNDRDDVPPLLLDSVWNKIDDFLYES